MPFVFTNGHPVPDAKWRLICRGIREERAAAARRNGLAVDREESRDGSQQEVLRGGVCACPVAGGGTGNGKKCACVVGGKGHGSRHNCICLAGGGGEDD